MSGGIFSAFGPGRGWSRLWRALAALVVFGQLALFAHQANHYRSFDLASSENCALCHLGTTMADGPNLDPLVTLPANEIGPLVRLPDDTAAPRAVRTPVFRSRAPPHISIA